MSQNALIPMLGVVTDIRRDTPDVKTFRVQALDGGKCFEHIPGQCAMLSIPGVGEAMFSITSSPTVREYQEFSIKKCGCLTSWLHQMDVGQQITIRGPYGNGFPVEGDLKGKDLIFIAGGIGLAPSANIGKDCAIFEAVHGSAPKHAERKDANPTALILSAVMMLRHLGEREAADRIEGAVLLLFAGGERVTRDIGGSLGTSEFADAVIEEMSK